MFRKRSQWLVIVLCMITTGCVKNFDLQLEATEPLYVIEGRISNLEGPYLVRITKTTNQLNLGYGTFGPDSAEAVTGARVIISDDAGAIDTLIPLDSAHINRYGYVLTERGLDSMPIPFLSTTYTRERGYYQTTHLKGEPGHTYHLEVQSGQDTFHASAYMPFVPTLDSAVIKETVVTPKGGRGLLPFVYFKEPENEKNYYLLQFNEMNHFRYDLYQSYVDWYIYPFYVVDDKILPSYVNGLEVRVIRSGHSTWSGSNWYTLYPNTIQQVKLSSLTREAYEYFRVLISQFEDDGNAYKPVPASAAGNINGGALGLFYATHVSYKLVRP